MSCRGCDFKYHPDSCDSRARYVPDPLQRDWLSLTGTQNSASSTRPIAYKSTCRETPLCRVLNTSRGCSQKASRSLGQVPESPDSGTVPPLRGVRYPSHRDASSREVSSSRYRERPDRATGAKRRRGPPVGSGVVRCGASCRATARPPQGPESGGPVREQSERTSAERQSAREARSRRKRGLAPRPGSRAARPERSEGPLLAVRRRSL